LEEIAGIGPKKAELLIKRFGSVNGVTEAVILAIREELGEIFGE